MKAPTIQSGKYRIRYRQISFVERFFFIDIKKDSGRWDHEFMKFKAFHLHGYSDIPLQEIFGFLPIHINGKLYTKLVTFMNEVVKYDRYLDDKE